MYNRGHTTQQKVLRCLKLSFQMSSRLGQNTSLLAVWRLVSPQSSAGRGFAPSGNTPFRVVTKVAWVAFLSCKSERSKRMGKLFPKPGTTIPRHGAIVADKYDILRT